MDVAVLYSSRFGHTIRIADRIADHLRESGHTVHTRPVVGTDALDPRSVEGVILGASVRYGVFSRDVWSFARSNAEALSRIPTAFFGVCLSATTPGRDRPDTNAYTRKFLERTSWKPDLTEVFAGEVNFSAYGRVDSCLMERILKISGKPYGRGVHVDYTDWEAADTFAGDFGALLSARTTP